MNNAADADLIVVGSGVAGLAAALAAAEQGAQVLLVTAGAPLSGSSRWAQGGIAAAVGPDDSPELHAADTMAVGAGLNDLHTVEILAHEGRRAVLDLLNSGVPFDGAPGRPNLGLEAGHSRRRILHAGGGATGEVVSSALLERAMRHPHIEIAPCTPVDTLLVEHGRVAGVISGRRVLRSHAVVLATGGYAGLWSRSTNPPGNRGIGLYLAWQAGASLADLEFTQFHPTALQVVGAPAYLLSEALRGEGALLVDDEGRAVVDPLLPRDVVARAIARHINEAGPVYLSLRHLDARHIEAHFSTILEHLREWGLDLARDLLPVAPAAHYCMGGVRTDTYGRTDLPGLYAAGEVACTGVQGANRLASNSLLECLVFGRRAAVVASSDAARKCAEWPLSPLPVERGAEIVGGIATPQARPEHYLPGGLGARLDRDLGVERDAYSLRALVAALPNPETDCAPPDHVVASLVARAALLREESRGAHYRTDAQATHGEWRGRIIWRRDMPPQFEEVPSC
ncbi:MAG TPA: FAD-dependent oxidoreductase [Chloroflexia bacterium]|nr:FAD-dependent oxidoreductase [Chloroflexia bacterium]